MINGKLLLLPYSAIPNAMLYNKDLFDKANIPYPQGDWTWEQFSDISLKLDPDGVPLLDYSPDILDFLMAGTGKGVLSPNGDTSVGYLDSPEAIRTLQWLNAYYHDKKITTLPVINMNLYEQFNGQETGMFISNISLLLKVAIKLS